MGLLDDVLGQLAGGDDDRAKPAGGAERGAQSSLGPIVSALLPVVLAMLAGSGRPQAGGEQRTGGGLGGLLGQLLGGAGAGQSGGGGLGALLEQFGRAGFGDQARSWVGTEQNQPISPDAIEKVFGVDGVTEIAQRAGVSEPEAARGLSQIMPELIDRMTPDGQIPDGDSLVANLGTLAKRFGLA